MTRPGKLREEKNPEFVLSFAYTTAAVPSIPATMITALQFFAYLITWTMFPLGIISSLIRIYSCRYVTRIWKPDDYMGVFVGVTLMGALAFFQIGLSLGCGGHLPNKCNYFDPSGHLVRYLYILPIYYHFMHFLIKSAFLTYYLRLSPNRTFRLWVGAGFGLVFGSLLIGVLILVFQCVPVKAALKLVDRLRAQCMDRQYVLYAPAAINILLDVYVFGLPIPTLARLQMPRRKKWGIIAVFLFGAASVLMSLIRFHSVQRLLDFKTTSNGVGEIIIVVALELNLAAIAVNLPAIRAIFVKRKNDRRAATLSSGQYSKTQGSLATTATTPTTPRIATEGQIMKATRIEMSSYPNPLRDSPLSGSQEELWRNIDSPNGDVPTRQKTVNRNERFTSIDLL